MPSSTINFSRLILAGLAAGGWVFVSGILMAALFGYREMKAAFDTVGLTTPAGAEPFIVHTVVRLLIGMAVATLFAVGSRGSSPVQSMFVAAGLAWLLVSVLPFAVIVEWGLFSWALALKLWGWSAAELLIAAAIARWLYTV